ncbi:MAG: sulfur transferase domain-containing protein [Candidatus Eisenbacteria bacterium]
MMRRLFLVAGLLSLAAPAWSAGVPKPHARPMKPSAISTALPDSSTVLALLAGVHNGACPLPGVATGGQPEAANITALAKAGFRTMLDLRAADEPRGFDEDASMKAAGVRYVKLPVTPATLDDAVFEQVRRLMTETGGKGVFVHCASGNRVGAALIPWLVLDRGWDVERAVTAAKAGGLKSAEMEAKARDYIARRHVKG